jgi:hypothetical protein
VGCNSIDVLTDSFVKRGRFLDPTASALARSSSGLLTMTALTGSFEDGFLRFVLFLCILGHQPPL